MVEYRALRGMLLEDGRLGEYMRHLHPGYVASPNGGWHSQQPRVPLDKCIRNLR